MRGSACVEVMTTLHGSTLSLRRHAEGCIPPEGMITSTRDPLKSTIFLFKATLTLQVEPMIIQSRLPSLHMGTSEGLQSLFSYNSDPVLPLLISNKECLHISASLSISWTTPCCMVLVSSYLSLSRAHFLPRALDTLLFLSQHILSTCCHFLLDVLGYAH